MKNTEFCGIMLTLLLISMLTLTVNIQPAKAEPTTWTVDDDGPADFSSIQEAINVASSGDTIFVRNGTYNERVILNKTVLLIGENNKETIINGPWGNVVSIVANNVRVANFKIQGGSSTPSERWSLAHIYVGYNSHGNIIENNVCSAQIALDTGSYNNTFYNNTTPAFWVYFSTDNYFSTNAVSGGTYGFHIYQSPRNTIVNNAISNCWNAIRLMSSGGNNKISNHSISLNSLGIIADGGNWITANNIFLNGKAYGGRGNTIYHNNFINNDNIATEDLENIWDNGYPSGGNYYSNYAGNDIYSGLYQNLTGSDGIGDTPYPPGWNYQDNYPLMNPWTPTETTLKVKGKDYPVAIVSNTTIDQIVATTNTLHFKSSEPTGEKGYILVIFPMVNTTEIKVFIDGVKLTPPPFPVINTNGTHYFIYFEFTLSTHDITIQFAPPPIISATADIDPDTLNLKSQGQWITAYIELPEDYNVGNINVNSILLNDTISVDVEAPIAVGDYDLDDIPDLMVKFDRATIREWLGTIDHGEDTGKYYEISLTITGTVTVTQFSGADKIKVLQK